MDNKQQELVELKGIDQVLMCFIDPNTKEFRVVMFGEVEEMLEFWKTSMHYSFIRLHRMLETVTGRKLSTKEVEDIIEDGLPIGMRNNALKLYSTDNHKLDVSYKVSKYKK